MDKIYNTKLIKGYMSTNNMSKTAFAKYCRISYQTLNKILNNDWKVRINAVFKIALAIEVSACEMFRVSE